jgi:hypothetical protein
VRPPARDCWLELCGALGIVAARMTASQKSRLGQGLFFGVFFIVLGSLMKFWTERGTAPYNGGRAALALGIFLVLWGAMVFYKPGSGSSGS